MELTPPVEESLDTVEARLVVILVPTELNSVVPVVSLLELVAAAPSGADGNSGLVAGWLTAEALEAEGRNRDGGWVEGREVTYAGNLFSCKSKIY